jgi:hypothetical protein
MEAPESLLLDAIEEDLLAPDVGRGRYQAGTGSARG